VLLFVTACLAAQCVAFAQPAALRADPWPRDVSLPKAALLRYQPQVLELAHLVRQQS